MDVGVGPPIFVCTPQKTGSSTMRVWAHELYSGLERHFSNVFSEEYYDDVRELGLGFVANNDNEVPKVLRLAVGSSAAGLYVRQKVAIVRDPLERAVSAFYSKVACDADDVEDRERVMHGWRNCAKEHGLSTLADVVWTKGGEAKACLTPSEFVRVLRAVQHLDIPAQFKHPELDCLDRHFHPWSDICRFDAWHYDRLVRSEEMEHFMNSARDRLHLPGSITTGVEHKSKEITVGEVFSPEEQAFLKEFYAKDFANLLHAGAV